MSFILGIISALIAPFAMVVGFVIWDNHWNGSTFALNMYKCNLAALGFAVMAIYTSYSVGFSPDVFTTEKVGFLMVSSTIGILIGDWTWLEGMRILGARKVIVMDSLKPFLAAYVGRVFLGEKLKLPALGGLLLTVVGVALVGVEKEKGHADEDEMGLDGSIEAGHSHEGTTLVQKSNDTSSNANTSSYAEQRKRRGQSTKELVYGMTMSLLNVLLHTFGALLTKKYGVGMSTWEINFIRFGFAGVCMLLYSILMQMNGACKKFESSDGSIGSENQWYLLPLMDSKSWLRISVGVAFVSFFQPALTNYAMFQISLALLLTLESIGPLYSLPLSVIMQNESASFRASLGALLAVAGIAILSFKGGL